MKIQGYNRNVVGGKRPHKKIQRYGKYLNLNDRFIAQSIGLAKYLIRSGLKDKNYEINFKKYLKSLRK